MNIVNCCGVSCVSVMTGSTVTPPGSQPFPIARPVSMACLSTSGHSFGMATRIASGIRMSCVGSRVQWQFDSGSP